MIGATQASEGILDIDFGFSCFKIIGMWIYPQLVLMQLTDVSVPLQVGQQFQLQAGKVSQIVPVFHK